MDLFIFYFMIVLQLTMVPLLHACLAEHPRVCGMRQGIHSLQEEREVVYRV